jgi:hypothetical protein
LKPLLPRSLSLCPPYSLPSQLSSLSSPLTSAATMRLNALLLGATALLSLALAAPAPAPIDYAFGDIHNPNLPHLTSATFTPSLSHGMWCVTMLPLAFSVTRSSSVPRAHTGSSSSSRPTVRTASSLRPSGRTCWRCRSISPPTPTST